METQLVVDRENHLVEMRPKGIQQSPVIRIIARVVSYLFHPVFIPVYLVMLVVKTNAYLIAAASESQKNMLVATCVLMYVVLPVVSVLLMKALGFINSVYLRTQRDRIIPYVVCMIYYWWVWYVMFNRTELPHELVVLSLAIFLASIGGLIANISMKVSMHAIAGGIMAGFVTRLGFSQDISFGIYISIAIFLAGTICTSRFIVSDHTSREIYGGLLIGILSLLLAIQFA